MCLIWILDASLHRGRQHFCNTSTLWGIRQHTGLQKWTAGSGGACVLLLCGDLKTEECGDCDLGDCTEAEGLSLSSHQGLITADCWCRLHPKTPGGLIGPAAGMPSHLSAAQHQINRHCLKMTHREALARKTAGILFSSGAFVLTAAKADSHVDILVL